MSHRETIEDSERGSSQLSAIAMLREDLRAREANVTAREERLWGWRLIASARDGETERVLFELRARESSLIERESAVERRERDVAEREVALAGRLAAAEEDHRAQVAHLRQEIARLRSRVVGC